MNWDEQDLLTHIENSIAEGELSMYNFEKQASKIITDAKNYGVTIVLAGQHLGFAGDYKGSESVEKSLTRKITNYNLRVDQE